LFVVTECREYRGHRQMRKAHSVTSRIFQSDTFYHRFLDVSKLHIQVQ